MNISKTFPDVASTRCTRQEKVCVDLTYIDDARLVHLHFSCFPVNTSLLLDVPTVKSFFCFPAIFRSKNEGKKEEEKTKKKRKQNEHFYAPRTTICLFLSRYKHPRGCILTSLPIKIYIYITIYICINTHSTLKKYIYIYMNRKNIHITKGVNVKESRKVIVASNHVRLHGYFYPFLPPRL